MFVIARIRLATDPRQIETKTGTRMETAFGFADIDGEQGLPVGVVAFGSLADEQARVGDALTAFCHGYPDLSIIVVHHSRKAESDDPYDLALPPR